MKIIIRTDSSIDIGTGHVMRCLALADALKKESAQISFICRNLPGNICDVITRAGFVVHFLQVTGAEAFAWNADAAATKIILEKEGGIDWLVVDHYSLDTEWEKEIRPYVKRIMVIDDLANRSHDCDLLLDHNFHRNMETRYDNLVPKHCLKLIGPKYALLRQEFLKACDNQRIRDGNVKRILIFLGGSDPTNETLKVLNALMRVSLYHITIDVVIGSANPHKEQIEKVCSEMSNTFFHCQVENMAELMLRADLAIGAGGTSTWERCSLGLPSIVISIAKNQVDIASELSEIGCLIYAGWHEDVTEEKLYNDIFFLLGHPYILRHVSLKAETLVDGRGIYRARNLLLHNPESMLLRPASPDDCRIVFDWRNHPAVRKYSFDISSIPWEVHETWFSQTIASSSTELIIAENDSGPVGVLRYDFRGDEAMVSVYLNPHLLGLGLGSYILRAGNGWIKKNHSSINKITAKIKPENVSSITAFKKAGFIESHLAYVFYIE